MIDALSDDFVWRALLAGLLVVAVSGPLGCVVVWRRMAYFGDALAHAALLGTALALMFELNPLLGVVAMGVLISLLLIRAQLSRDLSTDTLLGIFAHGALAAGLLMLAVMQARGYRVDLMAYLFGDILSVSWAFLLGLLAICIAVIAAVVKLWPSILAISVDEELARSEGIAVDRVRLLFMLLIAVLVAVAMKIVGIILITALLIIPAAAARRLATSPESMVVYAILIGSVAVVTGLFGSMQWDTPAGPSIVFAATVIFFVTRLKPQV